MKIERSCYPYFLAADLLVSRQGGEAFKSSWPLLTSAGNIIRQSSSILHISIDDAGTLVVSIANEFDGPGLEYNVFGSLIFKDRAPWKWRDFTNECAEPPLSLFPGDTTKIVEASAKACETLRIAIWGK